MGKLSFVAGAAVGYVLGARAGHERYEQIKRSASRLWKSDPVQDRVSTATAAVKQQAAPFVTERLGEAVKSVGQQMRTPSGPRPSGMPSPSNAANARSATSSPSPSSGGEHLPDSIRRDADGDLPADVSGYRPGGA